MNEPTHADLRIDAGWVVPVEPAGAVLRAHSLLLRDGLIAALLPTAQAGQWQCAEPSRCRTTHCCRGWSMRTATPP
jgi:hypothetical protein